MTESSTLLFSPPRGRDEPAELGVSVTLTAIAELPAEVTIHGAMYVGKGADPVVSVARAHKRAFA
jgi:hypothetical protein